MTDRERFIFNDLMDMYEFEVIRLDDGTLQVNDLQGACLGDICDEIFKDEWEILDRMEHYHLDYIIQALEYHFDWSAKDSQHFDTFDQWLTFLEAYNPDEFDYDIAILRLITKKAQKVLDNETQL